MAKKSMIAREVKRQKLARQYADKRAKLRAIVADPEVDFDEKMAASAALAKLPRDSSYTRQVRRCALTGRPKGVYRKFGMGRNKLRQLAMAGEIPGLRKSSW
ncbi:30S ribosomal protein S14 [Guyparkeria hydrothermalis]|uniref:Small ribosomal subunit protein uS14 n=1 Tax=Guyparkeria halophila TaxID=47960 RepID=A0A6I6D0I3_9GAMM|nr:MULTISPECIES: 30S ribosomal protein S14 [Guyparkeria]MCL7750789.1 30S ribosomal protein S14 [Guyparkeria hydrothermalis]QGT79220.1 30S ribosomal protein S14 [Guyparkeria halophila]TKA88850.1 30S ribosomal protein S14 [Guyparkeria sp. SB14A]